MSVVMYNADLFCSDCGALIDVPKPSYEPPYDTDDYPAVVSEGETDSPEHCGSGEDCVNAHVLPSGRKIGALLGCDLTSDGEDYVRQAIAEGGEVAEYWAEEFYLS